MIVLVCLESPEPSLASRAALDLACSLGAPAQVVVLCAGGAPESAWKSARTEWSRENGTVHRVLHRIVQIQDSTLDKADFHTLGMVLAEAARHLEARVVFAGEHSEVEGHGMVPAALAHHLKAPFFARVQAVQLPTSDDEVLRVTVRSGGQLCTVECPLPAVLATSPALGGDGAQRQDGGQPLPPVEILTLAQLGLDASRLVPRPNLLGTLVPAASQHVQYKSFDEAAQLLLRRR